MLSYVLYYFLNLVSFFPTMNQDVSINKENLAWGSYLEFQLLQRWRYSGLWFEASWGKKPARPYLNKQGDHGDKCL
jgi:hypothetical protein